MSQPDLASLNLLFVRHGETQDNIDKILQGWRDTELTGKGIQEAKVLAARLREETIDAIYYSPLLRIQQTISPLLSDHPGVAFTAYSDLRGQGLGDLEGGSYDLVDLNNPRSADGQPGVEKFDDFVQRLKSALGIIIGVEAPKCSSSQGRNVVIATHGVAITALFRTLESSSDCQGFNPKLATRGPDAFEVRWPDSDDVPKLVVLRPMNMPIEEGRLNWNALVGQPFYIERWGKKEKAL